MQVAIEDVQAEGRLRVAAQPLLGVDRLATVLQVTTPFLLPACRQLASLLCESNACRGCCHDGQASLRPQEGFSARGVALEVGFVGIPAHRSHSGTHTAAVHWHPSQQSPLLACGRHSGPLKLSLWSQLERVRCLAWEPEPRQLALLLPACP